MSIIVWLQFRCSYFPTFFLLICKAAKDEWDFEHLGMSNHPFIKANYPHHEGIWGWGNVADQVVIMIRNVRRSMVECERAFSFITNKLLLRRVTH